MVNRSVSDGGVSDILLNTKPMTMVVFFSSVMLRNFFADPDFFSEIRKGVMFDDHLYHRHRLPNFRTLKG